MGFLRQEHWSGLPSPPPRNPPDSGIEPTPRALAGGFFAGEPPGQPLYPLIYRFIDPTQAGVKIAGRNINSLRHADDTTRMAESEEELKSLLMRVKKEREKAGLKLNIQKKTKNGTQSRHFMANR